MSSTVVIFSDDTILLRMVRTTADLKSSEVVYGLKYL